MSDILVGGPAPAAPLEPGGDQTPGTSSGGSAPELPDHDRRRSAVSLAIAAGLHVAAAALIALAVTANPEDQPLPPISVSLLFASSPTPSAQPALVGSGASNATPAALPGPSSGASSKAAGDGFVIPTPRSVPSGSSTGSPTGSSFRTAGGAAGGGESLPAVQSTAPGATVAASQAGSSTGTGGSSTQHGGQGVAVAASAGQKKGISDLLTGVDQAIATRSTGGGTGGTTAGAPSGGSASTSSAISGPGYTVQFDQPEVSKGRQLVNAETPKIPPVGKQGLTLKVKISFTLDANGVLSNLHVEQSSGYPEVDTAVLNAIRRWLFTSATGAPDVRGVIPYEITSK